MNKTAKTLTAMAIAGGVCLSATTGPAEGDNAATTMSYAMSIKPRDELTIDIKPKGESVGDTSYAAVSLKKSGKIAGRLEAQCVGIDATYDGHMCSGVVLLPEGSLIFEGGSTGKRVPNVGGRREIFAITGGTRSFLGAEGFILIEDRVTIELTP